ncbi:hypothetical protein NFI96_003732 [Prochilodus magdalenae]|nr:hypothetical protein NFI96_003732 [Prochilodus magdalenae]
MILYIPAIKAEISFSGMNFMVNLPYSLFHHNTEGQCGVCDNNRTNDCRLPNGQVASCESMAGAWAVNNTTCIPFPSPPPSPTCNPAICEVILSKVFEKCHKLSSPDPFYKACKYDVCRMGNSSGCFSLETYASSCADVSCPCLLIEYPCPSTKVYQACGPKVEETCNSKYNEKFVNCKSKECQGFKEGCFCPKGTTLFNTATDVCTSVCGIKPVCVFNDKEYLPGAKVPADKCKDCNCGSQVDPNTGFRALECSVVTCDMTCSQGFVYVPDSEKCCGKCVQQRCIYTGPDSTVYTIEAGNSFSPPKEKCMTYNCSKVGNMFVLVPITLSCPAFNQENCAPVFVNNEPKIPAITYPEFTITSNGIEVAVNITAIQALISFKGLYFAITLPISLFYNNTEGQCGCVGSDGLPQKPGDKWRMNCKDCNCSAESMGAVCEPVQCPAVKPCDKPGYENKTVDCCLECVCNTNLCPSPTTVTCKIGFEVVQNKIEGACCPTFSCKPKSVCVFNNTEYWVGKNFTLPNEKCEMQKT